MSTFSQANRNRQDSLEVGGLAVFGMYFAIIFGLVGNYTHLF